jgi:fructoselysine-6-phosphate deglycase
MFNFDVDRFLKIQKGAVSQKDALNKAIDEIQAKGFKNLFLIGSGGAGILMMPAEQVMKAHSSLPVYREIAADFLVTGNKHFDEKSLVVFASLSGTTAETIEAAKFVKEKGATTISFVGHGDKPLAELTDYTFVNFAEDDTSCESFFIQFYLLITRLMQKRGEFPQYDAFIESLSKLPEGLLKVKEQIEDRAKVFAEKIKNTPYHMLVSSGTSWGETFYYAMCILEEMQWIKTKAVTANDFFHGTLELVEHGVSVILLKGEDETRPLMDRVERFAEQYTDELTIFDTKEFELKGVAEEFRGLISPIVLATLLERVSAHLEHVRNHPLTTRRYYRRIKY